MNSKEIKDKEFAVKYEQLKNKISELEYFKKYKLRISTASDSISEESKIHGAPPTKVAGYITTITIEVDTISGKMPHPICQRFVEGVTEESRFLSLEFVYYDLLNNGLYFLAETFLEAHRTMLKIEIEKSQLKIVK